jgi:hypothetical protein
MGLEYELRKHVIIKINFGQLMTTCTKVSVRNVTQGNTEIWKSEEIYEIGPAKDYCM